MKSRSDEILALIDEYAVRCRDAVLLRSQNFDKSMIDSAECVRDDTRDRLESQIKSITAWAGLWKSYARALRDAGDWECVAFSERDFGPDCDVGQPCYFPTVKDNWNVASKEMARARALELAQSTSPHSDHTFQARPVSITISMNRKDDT